MDRSASFGYWLRRRRKALDLTQEELARCAGCVVGTIKGIEADERRPSKQLAARLAQCLELSEQERPAFIKAARAELAADRLPLPSLPVVPPPASSSGPTSEASDAPTLAAALQQPVPQSIL